MFPVFTLLVGMATAMGLNVVLRLYAFFALLTAALIVSLMSPGNFADKVGRVATAFGSTAGSIGVAIALAAVIGCACLKVAPRTESFNGF